MARFIQNTCPVCECTKNRIVGRIYQEDSPVPIPEGTAIVRCRNCRLLYVNPFPEWSEEDFSKLYGAKYFGEDLTFSPKWLEIREHKNPEQRMNLILKYIRNSGNELLEMGSGVFALMCKKAGKMGWKVTAQEPAEVFCKTLRELYPDFTITSQGFLELPNDKKYSVIYADSVLEHVARPVEYFQKASELLRQGGILYTVSPNENSLINYVRNIILNYKKMSPAMLVPYKPPYHILGYSKKSVKILAEKSGLELVRYIRRYDHYWFHALDKIKGPKKYPAALILYLLDLVGLGANLEIIMRKSR